MSRCEVTETTRSLVAERLLNSLTDQEAADISQLITMYERMSPETIHLLQELRKEEVEQIKEGLELVRSLRTLGRAAKTILLVSISVFTMIVAFGEQLGKLFAMVKGGR